MLGHIEEFDISKPKEWTAYASRLIFFLEANNVTDPVKRRAVLLSSCGGPKVGESISDFVADLRRLAQGCNFSDLEIMLRDRLVIGLRDEELQLRLFSRKNLTFESALEEALSVEAAAQHTREVQHVILQTTRHLTFIKSKREHQNKLRYARVVEAHTFDLTDAQTIITHRGAFRVKRLQFGISAAPGIFQNVIDKTVAGIQGVLPYFDDILIAASDEKELASRLETVLHRFSKAALRLKSDKCKFCLPRVEFLGFETDATGIHPAKAKVQAIQDAPTPKNKQQLQAFLGLLNFYHSFLKGKATVAEPLHRLLDKNARWTWTGKHEKAFRDVKRLLSSDAVLTHYDDHKPLLGLFVPKKETPQILSPRMLRWSILFNAYDYAINYRPGKEIANADALSRLPKQSTENNGSPDTVILLLETIDNSPLHCKDIARITAKDLILTRVLSWAWRGWRKSVSDERLKPYVTRQHEISIHNGCLLWGSRILKSTYRILKELHAGHPGIVRMKALARSYVWWPKMDSEIENLVRTCELCQQSRASPPHAPVHNIHGLPDIIVFDNGTQFTSQVCQEYLNKGGIKHITSAPFHPSSNGQAERMVRTTKESLKKMAHRDWEYNLANFLFCQRVTLCTTTGKSPAELLMNRRLRTILDRVQPDVASEDPEKNFEKIRTFETDDQVYAKNYSSGKIWKPATVVTPTGPLSYKVQTEDGQLWRRHIDQLRKRYVTAEQDHSAERIESQEDKAGEETVTAEIIPVENAVVVTTPREESAAASQSPDTASVGQQRSSTRQRRPPQWLKDYEC
ncbi:Uncharacterized protein T11_4754 [Trichinella zimbabwensis]|uniref:RNA-directed DNA polymerase n=1 Tax=Trichinella zimbabwensis TaxID=268475 RepID=A0A0V1GR58_9BILA|nr:Uncharacterized protein T11_4754 [Trichinella zimbabwensis]